MDAAGKQQEFDFRRAAQLNIRDACRLPDGLDDHRRVVSGGTLKTILVAVESYGPSCWATLSSIAARTGRWGRELSRRTVLSGLQALVRLDVLAKEVAAGGKSGKIVTYAPIWQNLERYVPGDFAPGKPGATQPQPGATQPQPGATQPQPGAKDCTLSAKKQEEASNTGSDGPQRAEDVPIPAELHSPEFLAARDAWLSQRRRRRLSIRPDYVATQYARLIPLGSANAIACLRYSLDNDYQGLFPERFSNGYHRNRRSERAAERDHRTEW